MRFLILVFCFFPFAALSAQLVFSERIMKEPISDALKVQAWGDQYIIRTSDVTSSPLDYTDYLLLVDSTGELTGRQTFNPFAQTSRSTTTDFVVQSDTTYVVLAVDEDNGEGPGRGSLYRLNTDGDTLASRSFDGVQIISYSLCAAGNGLIVFIERSLSAFRVRAVNEALEDVYDLAFTGETSEGINVIFNAIYLREDGRVYLVYGKNQQQSERTFHVAQIAPSGSIVGTRQVGPLLATTGSFDEYTGILPLGENGLALLEGFKQPTIGCVTGFCTEEIGSLRIYPDAFAPSEVYTLDFAPFGMELLADDELFVYGTTTFLGRAGNGVLFNPDGWPDGNRVHLIEDPVTSAVSNQSYNSIFSMSLADNGDIVGLGKVGIGDDPEDEETHWLFRLGRNGCFTEDCSDLADSSDELVPVSHTGAEPYVATYPNPFVDRLTIRPAGPNVDRRTKLGLYDLNGRLLREGELGDGLQWATDDLSSGVYLVTYTDGHRRTAAKVIKR